jgi:transcriptional regulator with XRE-family HTH domain
MSTIKDVGTQLAQRVAAERANRGWSLAELAARSDVSRSMLSKIEREEASPTASVLVRIAAAFDLTLAELLTESAPQAERFLSASEQEVWVDPETGYRRRQIYLSAQMPLELVEVLLPAGAKVTMAESAYLRIRQVVWLLKGRLSILEGDVRTVLKPGDRLEFGAPADCTFMNESSEMCRYLVAVVRR